MGQKGWGGVGGLIFNPLFLFFHHFFPNTCTLQREGAALLPSLLAGAKELEEEGEDVDDVQVDVEGSEDVFLRVQRVPAVPHQHLGVKGQEL